ncbi:MAG: hypothetical protein CYG59_14280 [Chloroflexi bacterium]|nr:MAG: hypothetical protein CYG59_14280 [Chloroflexota bacterium]
MLAGLIDLIVINEFHTATDDTAIANCATRRQSPSPAAHDKHNEHQFSCKRRKKAHVLTAVGGQVQRRVGLR